MDKRLSYLNKRRECGFTLLETMIAITILSVGLLSMAGLIAKATGSSNMSRYTSTQSLLASEKLDELSAYPAPIPPAPPDANIAAGGSLAADTAGYFDDIMISNGTNGITESQQVGSTYNITTHSPNGTVSVVNGASTPPPTTPDTLEYDRRWVIEQDQPVVGARRITVLVHVLTSASTPTPDFQMSIVRP